MDPVQIILGDVCNYPLEVRFHNGSLVDLPPFRGHKDKPVLDGKDVSNGYKRVAEAAEQATVHPRV